MQHAVGATDAVDRQCARGVLQSELAGGPAHLGAIGEGSGEDPTGALSLVEHEPPTLADTAADKHFTAGKTHVVHPHCFRTPTIAGEVRRPPPAVADARNVGEDGTGSALPPRAATPRSRIVAQRPCGNGESPRTAATCRQLQARSGRSVDPRPPMTPLMSARRREESTRCSG